MFKQIALSVLLTLFLYSLQAQNPFSPILEGELGKPKDTRLKLDPCPGQNAGTIQAFEPQGNFQSNDIMRDTIFLCFGDQMLINHAEDFDLAGDPRPNTEGGISYIFYNNRPTIDGPDLATIATDPAAIPNPLDPNNPILMNANTSRDADVFFSNNGAVQNQFNNGFPTVLWFAPVTVDAFTEVMQGGDTFFVPTYEDDPAQSNDPVGPCVSVSIDEAFAVAFLNDIEENGVQINPGALTGVFRIGGGFPQVDDTGTYTISIARNDNPNVQGRVTNEPISHAGQVEFSVPELGLYTVTVEDGKSCPYSFEINFVEGITLEFGSLNIPTGGSGCVDLRVQDFEGVFSFQFPLTWDGLPIRFDSVTNLNTDLVEYTVESSFNADEADFGRLITNWADLRGFQAVTLDDNAVLFSICFTARGNEGDCSTIEFDENAALDILIENSDGQPIPLNLVPGQICISDQPFDVVVNKQDIPCTDDGTAATGSITFTPSHGAAPYRYELIDSDNMVVASGDNVQDGEAITIDDLDAGDYDLVLFDRTETAGSIAVFTEEVTISQASNFGVNIEPKFVPISCFGAEDGVAVVEITEAGVEIANPQGYSYLWNTGDTTRLIRDIGFGDYIVTVTKDGCSKIAAASVSQPDSIRLTINDATKNATCDGINDGLVVFDVMGGFTGITDSFSFQWNFTGIRRIEAGITIPAGGLTAGEYFLTVTDDNGCQQSASAEIFFDKQIAVSPNVTDITCFGGNDGEISINASTIPSGDESMPYSFTWETDLGGVLPDDTNTSTTLSGVTAGTYIVEIEDNTVIQGFDAFRCIFRDTFEVIEPERIELEFDKMDATCFGDLVDGRFELEEPVGGTAPFSYVWDSLPGVTGRIAENLLPGDYKVILTDANSCQDSVSFTIETPALPTITGIDTSRLNCSSDMDGQLTVMFELSSDMNMITDFEWSNGDEEQTTSATLGAGEYTIKITDQNGCFTEGIGVVLAPDPLMLDTLINTSPTCPGFDDGEISVVPIGGTSPYTFSIDGSPSTGATFARLLSGTYEIMVTDANNCPPLTETVVIEEPPSILVSFTDIQGTDCSDNCTGGATATAIMSNGEERTFDFQWTNSGEQNINTVSSTAMSLCAGENVLNVTDDGLNGCSVEVLLEIPSPPPLSAALSANLVSCFGANDGGGNVTALGGTADYRFEWSDGSTGETISGLAPGAYEVTVIDANECIASNSLIITQPDSFVVRIADATRTVTCAGDEDGFIQLGISGGNGLGGSAFNWADNAAGERDTLATNLGPGTYFVTVTDQNGCMDSISYSIGEPTPILAIIPMPDEPACFGFQTSIAVSDASGGAGGPYSFSVNNLNTVTLANSIPVFGGQEHLISVFDVRGCSFDTTIFINQPPPVEVNLPAEIEVQLGDSIRLRPDVFSVVPIDTSTILWTPDEFLSITNQLNPIVTPIDSRRYTLTLADLNGCTGEAMVLIDVDKRRNVYIPNVISPNSIQNSQFQVFTGLGVRKMNFMRIYDRWGELVYELGESGTSIGGIGSWDGTLNGKALPSGVYVYIVEMEFIDEAKLLYRGDVTVIR